MMVKIAFLTCMTMRMTMLSIDVEPRLITRPPFETEGSHMILLITLQVEKGEFLNRKHWDDDNRGVDKMCGKERQIKANDSVKK